MSSNKLEFKITKDSHGKDIELDNMSLGATKSLIVLLESLTNIINLTSGNENVRIQIIKGSAAVVAPISNEQLLKTEEAFEEVIDNQSSNSELVSNWRNLQSLILANGLQYELNFIKDSQKIPIIDKIKTKKLFRTKSVKKSSEFELTFLSGKLNEVGGKFPNIHLLDKLDNKITVNCKEEEAIKVNTFLYKTISVSAWCKKVKGEKEQYFFCDFYQNEETFNDFKAHFSVIKDLDEADALVELHYRLRFYIDNNNFGLMRKFLRLFLHESVDIGSLKTILIITKSFKNHEMLIEIRQKIKSLVEAKLGRKLI